MRSPSALKPYFFKIHQRNPLERNLKFLGCNWTTLNREGRSLRLKMGEDATGFLHLLGSLLTWEDKAQGTSELAMPTQLWGAD
ncbi:ROCO family protein [Corchorus olitorius]|uniref:ROCO family protein n=1 Tax=Corchorus olitorius TaxID=93759 RepID=A0A1R3G448_9ROSI|nr:ROCO family protein [Corchorus olitorius]